MSDHLRWSSNSYFVLAVLCYTISLSSVDTFAVSLIRTRLGALSLPILLIFMVVMVVPCRFLELSLGQYSNKATLKVWDVSPLFRGVGWNGIFFIVIQQLVEQLLSSRLLLFAVLGFKRELPWISCNHTWVRGECHEMDDYYLQTVPCGPNYTHEECDDLRYLTSIQHFWLGRILKLTTGDIYGDISTDLLLCDLFTTFVIFFATRNGTKSIETFLWILFVVPTVQMIIIFFTTLTNAGGVAAMQSVFSVTNTDFFNIDVWTELFQVFLTCSGIGTGIYTTFGTQCSFRNPLYLKVILISLTHLALTVLYASTIANCLGIFCYYTDTPPEIFERSSKSYLSVKMVLGMFYMGGDGHFLPIMWFTGIYLVALRGLIIIVFILIEILYNSVPKAQNYPTLTSLFICTCLFALSLILYTKFSVTVLNIFQTYSYVMIVILNSTQIAAIVLIYSLTDFMDDIHFMLGIRPPFYWYFYYMFSLITSIYLLVVVLIDYHVREQFRLNLGWTYWITNALIYGSCLIILAMILKHVIKMINSGNCSKICYPAPDWGPRHEMLRKSRQVFTSYHITAEYMYRQERKMRHMNIDGDIDEVNVS